MCSFQRPQYDFESWSKIATFQKVGVLLYKLIIETLQKVKSQRAKSWNTKLQIKS